MSYLFGIAGFLFGAALEDPGIAVLGGVLGYLLIEHLRLRRRIATLEQISARLTAVHIAAQPSSEPEQTAAPAAATPSASPARR